MAVVAVTAAAALAVVEAEAHIAAADPIPEALMVADLQVASDPMAVEVMIAAASAADRTEAQPAE
jgi:hypothetical protein